MLIVTHPEYLTFSIYNYQQLKSSIVAEIHFPTYAKMVTSFILDEWFSMSMSWVQSQCDL